MGLVHASRAVWDRVAIKDQAICECIEKDGCGGDCRCGFSSGSSEQSQAHPATTTKAGGSPLKPPFQSTRGRRADGYYGKWVSELVRPPS